MQKNSHLITLYNVAYNAGGTDSPAPAICHLRLEQASSLLNAVSKVGKSEQGLPYHLRNISPARTNPLLPMPWSAPPLFILIHPSWHVVHTPYTRLKTSWPSEHILKFISSVSKETSKQAPPLLSYHPQHIPNILHSLTFNFTQNASSIYVLANFIYQLE